MTTRDELREKVAQAISDATLDWCGETPEIWDSHRIAADAALAVVRAELAEPSEAMLDRGVSFALNVTISGEYGWTQYMRDLWSHQIAASPLAEPGA